MRDGGDGRYGSPGNEESVTYRCADRPEGSNPTLTAILKSMAYRPAAAFAAIEADKP